MPSLVRPLVCWDFVWSEQDEAVVRVAQVALSRQTRRDSCRALNAFLRSMVKRHRRCRGTQATVGRRGRWPHNRSPYRTPTAMDGGGVSCLWFLAVCRLKGSPKATGRCLPPSFFSMRRWGLGCVLAQANDEMLIVGRFSRSGARFFSVA